VGVGQGAEEIGAAEEDESAARQRMKPGSSASEACGRRGVSGGAFGSDRQSRDRGGCRRRGRNGPSLERGDPRLEGAERIRPAPRPSRPAGRPRHPFPGLPRRGAFPARIGRAQAAASGLSFPGRKELEEGPENSEGENHENESRAGVLPGWRTPSCTSCSPRKLFEKSWPPITTFPAHREDADEREDPGEDVDFPCAPLRSAHELASGREDRSG